MEYTNILLLQSLPLSLDVIKEIKYIYKYELLEKKYKRDFNKLNKHFLYYCWLNKKLNKKDNLNVSIIKTIKEFDYYKK